MMENLEKRNSLFYLEGTDELADGTYTSLDEGGALYSEFSISKGKRHGSWIIYWSNGNIACKAEFEEGICNGDQFFYYKNGQIQSHNKMKNDVRHGLCKEYNENGSIVKVLRFKYGEQINSVSDKKKIV